MQSKHYRLMEIHLCLEKRHFETIYYNTDQIIQEKNLLNEKIFLYKFLNK